MNCFSTRLFILPVIIGAALLVCFNSYGQGVMGVYPLSSKATSPTSAWSPVSTGSPISRPAGINDGAADGRRKRTENGPNYKSFTPVKKNLSAEAMAANAGYENHPDFGVVYAGAPCDDCYELLSERTETTKTFVREGIHEGSKEKMTQTSTQPMHYRDAQGNWRTIKTQLQPDAANRGIYTISEEAVPVKINTNAGSSFSSLGKVGESISFNHNLELIYVQPDGRQVNLGAADYTHHTAGDGGVYVNNAWPGIDIEIGIMRSAIKTNFHINHALPQYAAGKLLIRDHLLLDNGLSLNTRGQTETSGELMVDDNTGAIRYAIGAPTVYEKGNYKNSLEPLSYLIGNNNVLDIALPGSYLNKPALAYPVIIDPLVSTSTTTTINGSSYIGATLTATSGCAYANAANTPTNCTITDIQFTFQYTAVFPNYLEYAGEFFYMGACRSPGTLAGGNVWRCLGASPGTCTTTTPISIWGTPGATTSGLSTCIPPPQCPSYPLNITMYFYQAYAPAAACATTYAYGSEPLVITVYGHTVEFVSATAGPATICAGSSTSLTAVGDYGVPPYTYSWTPGPLSGSPVTVSPAGTTTYNLTITDACGITATGATTVTVITEPPITGTLSLCVGNTTTLGETATGAHTWTSSNTGVATITSPGGVVTAVGPGTTTISYTTTGTGCSATAIVTVTALPTPILGTLTICPGATTTLTDATAGGAWSSSNPGVATISAGGLVTGVATGVTTITYGSATCYVTATLTVSNIAPITGTLKVCPGNTTTLADAAGGGTWSSGTTGVATIGAGTGVVTGVAGGTSTIVYTTAAGCTATAVVTVNPIAPITGILSLCAGSTSTLNDAVAGGTWSSSNLGVATIGAGTGIVSGLTNGTSTIAYTTAAGCTATAVVTVTPLAPITGTLLVCQGSTTTLADAAGGGTWNSSNTAVATIGVGTGVVTGVSGGTSTIVYTTGAGCTVSAVVTVNPISPITGTLILCPGATSTLADAAGGGTWSSSTTAVATIGAGTGVVSGISGGTSTIVYTAAGCTASAVVTVSPLSPITGTLTVCQGNTTTLANAVGGGGWTSGTPAVATIGAGTGIVTGVSGGTSTIVYTTGAGCSVSAVVTVNPISPITGTLALCAGATSTLADATPGGTWNSGTPAIATIGVGSGLVTGISNGTSTIVYTTAAGCTASAVVTVNPLSPITGTLTVCQGSTTTLADAAGGGGWTSGTPGVATIGAGTGVVTGVSGGTSTIVYTTASGCSVNAVVTVNPISPITGLTTVCVGSTSLLNDAAGGGTWSSTTPGVATVSGTGLVTGVSNGTTTISYITAAGCSASITFNVNNVAPITGTAVLCVGATTTLGDATPGGTWASTLPGVATIGAGSGLVTGVSGGTTSISYTSGAGCFSTRIVTVNAVPAAITGITNVCVGLTTTLSDVSAGGTWASSTPGVASVSGSVVVSGVSAGVATITYTLAGGCYTTIPVLVNPLPAPIGGGVNVCLGTTVTLNDPSAGGTWLSNNTSIATIDAGGMVTGISVGTATITYTLGTGCIITAPMTVVPLSAAPITSNLDYCQNETAVALTAIGTNLLWYTAAVGGAGSASAPIPPTNVPGVTTWYVSQNSTGCEGARAPLQVTVHVHVIFSIVPTRPTACQGDTISFAYSGPTFTGETYSWTLPSNGVLYAGSSLDNSSITMYYDTVLGGNYIMLTVGDGYAACNSKDTLAMTVYVNTPDAAFYVKPNVCFGDSVTVALSHIGAGVTDYTWDFGGATVLAGSSNHGGPFIVTFPSAGIYSVTLTAISNLLCPSIPIIDTVDVHAKPDATFSAVPKSTGTLCLEDSILFKAHYLDANCYYLWQPEHCFNNNNQPAIWGKLEQGRTAITLTVTDPFGCTASSTQQFSPEECCSVLFPNAFTPNGDGLNDKFRPIFNGYHNFHEFRIVNRWGQTVFESANSEPSWDGSFGGVPQDMGVYYYFISYDCGGNTIEAKGDLTLVR